MANHAYIYGKLPGVPVLDRAIRGIMEKFPELTVKSHFAWEGQSEEEICWEVYYNDPEYSWLKFFIRKDKFRRKPALNFRHGHSTPFMWWIEYTIREQLAVKFDLKQYDEGIGDCDSEYKDFRTYEEYFLSTREGVMAEIGYHLEAETLFKTLPESLHKYIGQPAKEVKTTQENGKVIFTIEE